MGATPTLVYRPKGAFRIRAVIGAVVLLVLCVVLLVPAIASGSYAGAVVLAALALLALWLLVAMGRQRVELTADELIVQGKLSRVRLRLADVTAMHHQDRRGTVTWVAATGQRPFRIYSVAGHPTFLGDARARATACGARLDAADGVDMVAAPPKGTRVFFTLL